MRQFWQDMGKGFIRGQSVPCIDLTIMDSGKALLDKILFLQTITPNEFTNSSQRQPRHFILWKGEQFITIIGILLLTKLELFIRLSKICLGFAQSRLEYATIFANLQGMERGLKTCQYLAWRFAAFAFCCPIVENGTRSISKNDRYI